jgi:CRISPR-associated protein Csb2
MVAGGVGRAASVAARERAVAALTWLESLGKPDVFAPDVARDAGGDRRLSVYRSYVPDNIADKVARSWSAGREGNLADFRAEKDVRSLSLLGEAVTIRYLVGPDVELHLAALVASMRAVTHLGWGIDMVVGDARLVSTSERVEGEHWVPRDFGECSLRCPMPGTFGALEERHRAFLSRLAGEVFLPVPPLGTFIRQRYGRTSVVPERPFAAFRLTDPATGRKRAFDAVQRSRDVAAWLRHCVGEIAKDWPFGDARYLVHGHSGNGLQGSGARLSYVPLPTITPSSVERAIHVGDIGRVLVTAPPEHAEEIVWLQRLALGADLTWENRTVAALETLPDDDWVLRRYLPRDGATTWTTVTPVILPGHDDHSEKKIERLIRRAMLQAGLEQKVVDEIETLEWGTAGFLAGLRHARSYPAPDKVKGPRLHVRVRFAQPVRGPLVVGSGRHRGVGTFVALAMPLAVPRPRPRVLDVARERPLR